MFRTGKLRVLTPKALYDEVLAEAASAFRERRFHEALETYERFAREHPDIHPDQIQFRIQALKEYIEEHIEPLQRAATTPDTS